MARLEVHPIDDAVRRVAGKALAATKLRTADIKLIPVEIRDRALFSAGVDCIRTLQSMQDKLNEWSDFLAKDPDRALMGRGKFVAEMRQELGASPGDSGSIEDLTSERRLNLVYDFQTTDAAGYADWKIGMDPDILDAFPAQELIRLESREVPRGFRRGKGGALVIDPGKSWPERWEEAGGVLIDDRMVALKTDEIWSRISDFDRPFAPFAFNSGMGLRDVDRTEAEELGLLEPGEAVEPMSAPFNENLSASAEDVDAEYLDLLKEWFGDKVKVGRGEMRWEG